MEKKGPLTRFVEHSYFELAGMGVIILNCVLLCLHLPLVCIEFDGFVLDCTKWILFLDLLLTLCFISAIDSPSI